MTTELTTEEKVDRLERALGHLAPCVRQSCMGVYLDEDVVAIVNEQVAKKQAAA
ncbi:MAG: hypothetical protein ABSC90_08530 [Acidimicrobiales bacterium]